MAIIPGRYHWMPRQPVKRGTVNKPLDKINRIGGPSTAKGRQRERIHDRLVLDSVVQLRPGMLVIWDRKPHRVVEVQDRPDDWDSKYEQRFERDLLDWETRDPKWRGERPQRATWFYRPVVVVVVPDRQPNVKPLHLVGPASHQWQVLPEHYAVCVACGELPPCSHEIREEQIARELVRAEELMFIQPGCCHGCGEPVTSRQKAVHFPGPNLWRPDLGEGSAVFHGRQECAGDAARYREQWLAMGGSEVRQALLGLDGEVA